MNENRQQSNTFCWILISVNNKPTLLSPTYCYAFCIWRCGLVLIFTTILTFFVQPELYIFSQPFHIHVVWLYFARWRGFQVWILSAILQNDGSNCVYVVGSWLEVKFVRCGRIWLSGDQTLPWKWCSRFHYGGQPFEFPQGSCYQSLWRCVWFPHR